MRQPRLLNGHTMEEAARLHPVSMSVTLSADELSSATMLLLEDAPEVPLGAWVAIDTPQGYAGVFVVRSVDTDAISHTRTIDMEHALGLLMDVVAPGEHTPYSMGGSHTAVSAGKALAAMLAKQPEPVWQMGECEFDREQGWTWTDPTIYSALQNITQSLPGWAWRMDMQQLPWTLSLVRRPTAPTCEMRMSRNITGMSMAVDKSGMVTRMYATGWNGIKLPDPGYIDRNVETWGVISKVQREESAVTQIQLTDWANDQLDILAVPQVRISINALELSAATGEPLDRLVPGTMCRVPLPEYKTTVVERIISISWSDVIAEPENVTVTMANNRQTITNVLRRLDAGGDREQEIREKAEAAISEAKSATQKITTLEDSRIGPLERAQAKLQVTADAITATVEKYQYDSTGDMLEAWGTRINQSASEIQLYALRTDIFGDDETGQQGRLQKAESMIRQNADAITLMVNSGGSSFINLTGSGVTISGGTITLDGATLVDEISGAIDSHWSTGHIGVGSISGGSADFDELSVGTINNTAIFARTMTVNGEVVGTFFGPEDITFDYSGADEEALAAAYDRGAASVTLNVPPTWTSGTMVITTSNGQTGYVTLPSFDSHVGGWGDDNTCKVYFSTRSVNEPLITETVDASSVYERGFNAVEVTTDKITCTNVGPNLFYITVTASNGFYVSKQVRINVGQ